jgi:hypothetical protein
VHFRIACIMYTHNKRNNIPWSPADDGFVFSSEQIGRQLNLLDRLAAGNKAGPDIATDDEMDAFIAKEVL